MQNSRCIAEKMGAQQFIAKRWRRINKEVKLSAIGEKVERPTHTSSTV
jgi:hypothetical protein